MLNLFSFTVRKLLCGRDNNAKPDLKDQEKASFSVRISCSWCLLGGENIALWLSEKELFTSVTNIVFPGNQNRNFIDLSDFYPLFDAEGLLKLVSSKYTRDVNVYNNSH